ncbi:MAG: polyphosphate kinase 1 [Treponema sp.]|nr:polyphosphate kinase 1 [Treponema sp.]
MAKNRFFNRELSWIEFNKRVLYQACRSDIPLFERLQFLSIVTSNFNEFFQVRVASIKRMEKIDPRKKDISGFTPSALLKQISVHAHEVVSQKNKCLFEEILPLLKNEGFIYTRPEEFSIEQKDFAKKYFEQEILPLLTPIRADANKFPGIKSLNYHAVFMLKEIPGTKPLHSEFAAKDGKAPVAIVQIPEGVNRIIWLSGTGKTKQFTLLDNLIIEYGTLLFPGYEVKNSMLFNLVRDADFAVDEDSGSDFISAMEQVLEQRKSSFAVRMNCNNKSPELKKFLLKAFDLSNDDVYECDELLDPGVLLGLSEASDLLTKHLRFEKWDNFYPYDLPENEPFWDILKQHDILLHVPYQSYNPVVKFLSDAADDPDVVSIKMTLYRTGNNSPVISALKRAAANGKQVTVLVELKARFDEERNIGWANELESAGAIVITGIANLKVHAKAMMIIRREENSMKRYVHISTGNYNPKTARLYSDFSIFTADQNIAGDITSFFNIVTGYTAIQTMKTVSMAPINIKSNLIQMIEREASLSTPQNPGLIMAKMNSLTHEDVIQALYDASRKGVKIMLNVRGICMLVPGVNGMSENIEVISIVDRFLEHERIFYFKNAGAPQMFLASADWMNRNLDRRIELMFPVLDAQVFKEIKYCLDTYFESNTNVHKLVSDGTWYPLHPRSVSDTRRAQEILYEHYKSLNDRHKKGPKIKFHVRRKG